MYSSVTNNGGSCVELSHVKQMAAMFCLCGYFSTWHHNYPQ